ncbi:MAG: diguanylate cyclase [Sporomusaceae bacterium]|nr:diguanylate cyclase [Sporomusaceae bacterium]
MTRVKNENIRVLLVDDTPANLEIAGSILEKEGYDLYIADSGVTALELIEATAFDLILLDIMMPGLDGFETYKMMRKFEKAKKVPVIFLSAKVDIESIVRGFELGAVDYIRKPFNEAELKARVRTHVELKKMREELELKNKSLQEAYDNLEITAATDVLTQLLNRREMMRRLEYERVKYSRNKRPFSIVLADIDYFKKVNDTYGHEAGDDVLIAIAMVTKGCTRKADSVARWGGEEFMLLLPETDAGGAMRLAEKIRRAIEHHTVFHGEAEIRVTITLGICEFTGIGFLDELISNADRALYRGKAEGRNRTAVYDGS